MAEVFSLLLAGSALVVFGLAVPGFRRSAVPAEAEVTRAEPTRSRVHRARARLGAAGETAVARADGGHVLGRHGDRRCPH